jgi:hypothetical protein
MEFDTQHGSIVPVPVNGGLWAFDIKFNQMDETPLTKRPWFYIVAWLVILLIAYGWQIFRMGGIRAGWRDIFFDGILFFLLLYGWMAFFAQFVLPVQTFRDRQKIFFRLLTRLSGGHGPALFVENGVIKEHSGERLKRGPGVVWLDSASAAVTRTPVAIKQVMGPGVHFIETHEYIAGTLDLHIQTQTIGPRETDQPFADPGDDPSSDNLVQERRKQVSALTRDGIEIIPSISVTFRVATGFPLEGQPGSRFGYRKGNRKKDRENEEKDKDAIRRAILGEGVNPMVAAGTVRHRVAWNHLPAVLAVDVWREYVAKFTLDELFQPTQVVPPPAVQLPQPTEEEIDPLSRPIRVGAKRETIQDFSASLLREINVFMDRMIKQLEGKANNVRTSPPPTPITSAPAATEPQKKTALQVINEMVKARLTQAEVDYLDDHGVRGTGTISSAEFKLLQERGLQVLNVGINSLRLNPQIEETIIGRWSTTWLKNAKEESEQIERKRNIIESAGQDKAIRQYAEMLGKQLLDKKPQGVKPTLKTLLLHTRTIIIKNDQLRRRMTKEQQDLEEIIKWVEASGS